MTYVVPSVVRPSPFALHHSEGQLRWTQTHTAYPVGWLLDRRKSSTTCEVEQCDFFATIAHPSARILISKVKPALITFRPISQSRHCGHRQSLFPSPMPPLGDSPRKAERLSRSRSRTGTWLFISSTGENGTHSNTGRSLNGPVWTRRLCNLQT